MADELSGAGPAIESGGQTDGGQGDSGAVEAPPVDTSPRDSALERMDSVLADKGIDSEPAAPRARAPRKPKDAWLDDVLRNRGQMFGLGDADITMFGGREAAERYLEAVETLANLQDEFEKIKASAQQPQPTAQAGAPATAAQAKKELAIREWMIEQDLDPDGEGKALMSVLKKFGDELKGDYEGRLKAIEQSVHPLQTTLTNQQRANQLAQQQAYFRAFDGTIEDLGEPWSDVFGKGPTGSLPVLSQFRKARDKFDKSVRTLALSYRQLGEPMPGDEELRDQALWMAFPKEARDRIYATIAEKSRAAAGSFSARPGPRSSATPSQPATSPEELKAKALARMDDVLRKKGLEV